MLTSVKEMDLGISNAKTTQTKPNSSKILSDSGLGRDHGFGIGSSNPLSLFETDDWANLCLSSTSKNKIFPCCFDFEDTNSRSL